MENIECEKQEANDDVDLTENQGRIERIVEERRHDQRRDDDLPYTERRQQSWKNAERHNAAQRYRRGEQEPCSCLGLKPCEGPQEKDGRRCVDKGWNAPPKGVQRNRCVDRCGICLRPCDRPVVGPEIVGMEPL